MNLKTTENRLVFDKVNPLDLSLTLDCGQCFRWTENPDGSWHGVVGSKKVNAVCQGDELIIMGDVSENDREMWSAYFDLKRDYSLLCDRFCADKWLKKAVSAYPGIRVLHQEPWETLCSFIISQNNNIPRIKGIIGRLCCSFGDDLGDGDFTFPSAETIAQKGAEDLTVLRAGFRVKYILDAAKKVAGGEIDLAQIENDDIDKARLELQKISGVGPKVAECALLYGFGRIDAFPVDVWVRRIMEELYPEGLPECVKGVEGIAQQYLFHWRRNIGNPFEE